MKVGHRHARRADHPAVVVDPVSPTVAPAHGPEVHHPTTVEYEGVIVAHGGLHRPYNLFMIIDAVGHAVGATEGTEVGDGIELGAGGTVQSEKD
jgi:hypothetical protein